MFADIAVSIAAIVAACAAWLGLDSWRRELKERADYEVARNLLRATYKLRVEIEKLRSPFISAQEFPPEYDPTGEDRVKEAYAYHYVYANRFQHVLTATEEFDSQALEAESLWGEQIKPKTDEFRQCVIVLKVAIQSAISDKRSGGKNFERYSDFADETMETLEDYGKNVENKFSRQIKKAITEIESEIRPYIEKQ